MPWKPEGPRGPLAGLPVDPTRGRITALAGLPWSPGGPRGGLVGLPIDPTRGRIILAGLAWVMVCEARAYPFCPPMISAYRAACG